jgi:metallo-beta-lactamase family protein
VRREPSRAQANYAGRKGYSKHPKALPLFSEADARRALAHLEPLAFDKPLTLSRRVSFRLLPAGHILGAAIVAFNVNGTRLVFSGDLGRPCDPIMHAPAAVGAADFLVVESTYGNRRHAAEDAEQLHHPR